MYPEKKCICLLFASRFMNTYAHTHIHKIKFKCTNGLFIFMYTEYLFHVVITDIICSFYNCYKGMDEE